MPRDLFERHPIALGSTVKISLLTPWIFAASGVFLIAFAQSESRPKRHLEFVGVSVASKADSHNFDICFRNTRNETLVTEVVEKSCSCLKVFPEKQTVPGRATASFLVPIADSEDKIKRIALGTVS